MPEGLTKFAPTRKKNVVYIVHDPDGKDYPISGLTFSILVREPKFLFLADRLPQYPVICS